MGSEVPPLRITFVEPVPEELAGVAECCLVFFLRAGVQSAGLTEVVAEVAQGFEPVEAGGDGGVVARGACSDDWDCCKLLSSTSRALASGDANNIDRITVLPKIIECVTRSRFDAKEL
jgi:hypothetical protein